MMKSLTCSDPLISGVGETSRDPISFNYEQVLTYDTTQRYTYFLWSWIAECFIYLCLKSSVFQKVFYEDESLPYRPRSLSISYDHDMSEFFRVKKDCNHIFLFNECFLD